MFLIFILLAFLSLLPNLHRYPFKNEESLRTQIAFEMWHSGEYFQPTFLGEPYFNKPTLFNWFIILYSHLIPWSELTARAVSLSFLILTTLLVGVFSHYLFRNFTLSLLSSLIFLTFGNILFFYGYLAEIDITFGFFVFLGVVLLYLWWDKGFVLFAGLSGFVFGIAFLLKGIPAYAFMGISLIALSIYSRNLKYLIGKVALSLYLFSLLIPLLWLFQLPEPIEYLKNLWRESFSRVEGEFSRTKHMLSYPLINFKDLLPWSFLFLLSIYINRKDLNFPHRLRVLMLIFLLNYIPYWISDARGRYIIPLYPLLAVAFSYYMHKAMKTEWFKKAILLTVSVVIILKFLHSLFFFTYVESRETSRKKIAEKIASLIDPKSSIACQCPEEKTVCLYLGLWKGEPLRSLRNTKDAVYAVVCDRQEGERIAEFKLKSRTIRLERLGLNY